MSRRFFYFLAAISLFLFAGASASHAQWVPNGVPLSQATGGQQACQAVSDGAGGAIVTWVDYRGDGDVYAQRVDGYGNVMWTTDGIPISTATNLQTFPRIVSDGAGGAIISWRDSRGVDNDIYAQRIAADGTVQWTADGVAVCSATGGQDDPEIVSDEMGGAIITWIDARGGSYTDIYAQRIDEDGVSQWIADGKAVCTASGNQYEPQITTDGLNGAIITWYDYRNGNHDIYTSRVRADATVYWVVDGRSLCPASGHQRYCQIVSDGAGGAIVAWQDERTDSGDIYAQRVNSSGNLVWTTDGVGVCTNGALQNNIDIVTDGSHGAIILWDDNRGGGPDEYAQRIAPSGSTVCTSDGVPVAAEATD